ncbi:TNT domain-containing protein [Yinghuangia seranimata]|uniref:TNT domain-containing protein n=1 Tax=Yinghuangia seranimata TaxID=408067 RepID=UPI00248AAA25|nr:TNT domain-containing protein [Yinghuangia seranimata]MDI2132928.1 TNT domain-containing protein [Yinghuangia seranimata]
MRTRLAVVLVGIWTLLVGALAAPASAASQLTPLNECSATFYQGDSRLGPETLPKLGPVGFELVGYRRTGGESVEKFLGTYFDPQAGWWIYPPQNGYVIWNGQPVEWDQQLATGQDIDRFGSEYGSFLAPEGLPYAMRSIPPTSLNGNPAAGCNYHDYRVLKPFTVHAGPIAAWFAQPGGGLQYQLDGALVPGSPAALNVKWLVENGYLQRLI